MILSANLRQFTPLAGQSYLMDAIAAVFIGTAFTRLGRVSILGTLGGVLFLAIIDNGLNLMGLQLSGEGRAGRRDSGGGPCPILLAGAPAPKRIAKQENDGNPLTPHLSA